MGRGTVFSGELCSCGGFGIFVLFFFFFFFPPCEIGLRDPLFVFVFFVPLSLFVWSCVLPSCLPFLLLRLLPPKQLCCFR